MTKLWGLSVALSVMLSASTSASLFAQAPALPLPNDSVTAQNPMSPSQSQGNPEQPSASQTGIILGTVTDMNDAPVRGAAVALQGSDPSDAQDFQTVATNESGFFELRDVPAGRPYQVSIRAAGFAQWVSPVVTLDPGQSKILDVNQLRIEEVTTAVTVTPESNDEIATEQVKTEEKQRGFAIIPNFYAVYDTNPAPLTAKLRFSLALKVARDPFTLAGVATLAGFGQAANSPAYRQGAAGYGERFAANYANSFTEIMLDGAVLPSLLRQDPRYYYQGRGSTQSRVAHALVSIVVTRGDNGSLQPNYSSIGGDLASAALSNLYYPRANRGAGLVLQGFAVDTAVHAGVRLLDEFVFHPARETRTRNASNDSEQTAGNKSQQRNETATPQVPDTNT